MNLQPTLKGQLLEVRPLRPGDFPDLYAVASDPLLWEQHSFRDRYREEVFNGFFHEAIAKLSARGLATTRSFLSDKHDGTEMRPVPAEHLFHGQYA